MSAKTYLLPSEFHKQINAAASGGDPHYLARAIHDAWQRRHPDLVAVSAQAYYVPAEAAARLYRHDPTRYRLLAMSALGKVTAVGFWRRLAGTARDAFRAGDWSLLGWLAFYADASFACSAALDTDGVYSLETGLDLDAGESYGVHGESDLTAEQVFGAFHSAFNLDANAAAVHEYLTAALSYFHCLPKGFAVPPGVQGYAERSGESAEDASAAALTWSILRRFWTRHRGVWKQFPETIDMIRRYENPFLPLLAEQLQRCDDPLPRHDVQSKPASNPFAPLLGERRLWGGTDPAAPSDTAAPVAPPPVQAPPLVQATRFASSELPEEMFAGTGSARRRPRQNLGQRALGWLGRMAGWRTFYSSSSSRESRLV